MRNFIIFRQFLQKISSRLRFFKIDFSFVIMFFIAFSLGDIFFYFCFIVFLLLHELVHFFVAKKHGYLAGAIRLNFFGASLEGLDDFLLIDEIKIALAGPLFNLGIVIFCYICFWFEPVTYNYLQEVLLANLSIFVFNMLPIYPLDCGRILLAFFSKKRDRARALHLVKVLSWIFIFCMFILFLISFFVDFNFVLGFVTVNLACLVAKSASGTSYKRRLFAGRKFALLSRGLPARDIYISEGVQEISLFKLIDDYHFVNFIFLDKNLQIKGKISEIELFKKFGLI